MLLKTRSSVEVFMLYLFAMLVLLHPAVGLAHGGLNSLGALYVVYLAMMIVLFIVAVWLMLTIWCFISRWVRLGKFALVVYYLFSALLVLSSLAYVYLARMNIVLGVGLSAIPVILITATALRRNGAKPARVREAR